MKFRRIFIPVAMIVTMLVQFMPGAVFGARPVAATSACDAAEFVADVTIPDGTAFAPGAAMAKTFRLKNVGTCTWSTSYAIVFYSGSKMGAPSAVNLPTSVAPGGTVDVTVNMTAPSTPGHYRGNWMLRNASNVLFGVGPSGTWVFFIDIIVSSGSPTVAYDFTTNACAAVWTSGAGVLGCPGTDGDSRGFLLQAHNPKLENGATGSDGLLTAPQNVTDGYIQGVYPAYTVHSGDHFMSIINCDFGATGCYVTFQLQYQIGSGPINTLKSFKEKIDGMYYNLNVDLSSLAGQNVSFILKVLATGSPAGDRAVWSGPRIAQSGGPAPTLSSACDKAAFIADVTIPDGTVMTGGTAFVKTWRLMNVGTCTWTTSYRLVFDGGDYMGVASSAVNLPTSVAPGGTIDLSLNMIAPLSSGTYFSYWKLRNASGVDFGVGAGGAYNFFAKIVVSSSYSTAYSFAANASSAAWTSGAGALPFPGTDGDSRGFALPLGSHQMEDGTYSSEGLLTFPQYVTDGYIQGKYPAFTVQNGDHFQSYVGCQYHGPANCYVTFRLAYQIGAGPVTTLKTAAERLDDLVYRMDVDLSALAGQNVNFILRVEAFGSASGDRAQWSAPKIIRPGAVPPAPTPTPVTPVPTPTGVIVGPSAELSITINDSLNSYTPGGTATYIVVVHNAGPNNVTGASVLVTKPVQITTWTVSCVPDASATCTAGPISPAGNFTDPIDLPVGKNVTYTIVSNISGGAVGNMVTTATITNPGPTPDPNLANNSATDTDNEPSADLAISLNDGITVWVPGGTTTYTVVVQNLGPLNVTGAVFNDNKPIQITGWSWTCAPDSGAVCGAGSGGTITTNIADTANIPSGKKVTYTIVATMTTSVPGNLVNTVTITPPIGTPDPILTNNSATDTDLGPSADLSVTKTDGVNYYTVNPPSNTLTYTIRVVNNGPQAVVNAAFADNIPVQLLSWSWTCVPDFSSICTAGPVIGGNFTDSVSIPVGQGVTYTVVSTVNPAATGTLVNTASISVPPAFLDLVPSNNTATDIDAAPTADLAVTKTDGVSIYTPGGTLTYNIVVSNYGPVPVTGATFSDVIPNNVVSWIWTCVPDSGATCTSPGVPSGGNFTDTLVNLPSGKKVTYTVVASLDLPGNLLDIVNIAHVDPPAGIVDPILGNNDAVDTDVHPTADLGVTMSDGVTTYVPSGTGTYTIVVTNYGPSAVTAAGFADTMPANILNWSWTCTPQLGATCLAGTSVVPGFTDTVSIPAGRSITYTVVYHVIVAPVGVMTNTATLTAQTLPYPIPDGNAVNDIATDVDSP